MRQRTGGMTPLQAANAWSTAPRGRVAESLFRQAWGDLTTYNAERMRGIVHTPVWQDRMARKQNLYDQWVAGGYQLPEGTVLP